MCVTKLLEYFDLASLDEKKPHWTKTFSKKSSVADTAFFEATLGFKTMVDLWLFEHFLLSQPSRNSPLMLRILNQDLCFQ